MTNRIVPVFVPHLGCPNDCVFCDQRRISGSASPATAETVRAAIEDANRVLTPDAAAELAFYGGSFTAIPRREQDELLAAASPFIAPNQTVNATRGLRVSTRPDFMTRDTAERLKQCGVATIELGAQSMRSEVLTLSKRGHTPEDVRNAARAVRSAGLNLVLQMMTGLPGDTPEGALRTANELLDLQPSAVRVYPTVIVRGTELERMWRRGAYREHTVEDAVALGATLIELFERAGVPIIRFGLNATESLAGDVAGGAYHPALGELAQSRVYLRRARELLRGNYGCATVKLGVAVNRVSIMSGQGRRNARALEREFGIHRLQVSAADVKNGEIVILNIEK
ncbi:MAG: radical SAM protein [Oscillospiraceae bacterium]|jgi:histone acetyltransferase (RNA polymerase elongator complex component)|nr:radical SAM protein [Oscillospiraceae bacterium]